MEGEGRKVGEYMEGREREGSRRDKERLGKKGRSASIIGYGGVNAPCWHQDICVTGIQIHIHTRTKNVTRWRDVFILLKYFIEVGYGIF